MTEVPDVTQRIPPACAFDECDRQATKRGWCDAHYKQWRTTGVLRPIHRPDPEALCSYPICGRRAMAKGLCQSHYSMTRRGEVLRPIRWAPERRRSETCSAPGCDEPFKAKHLCQRHYFLQRKYRLSPERFDALLAAQGGRCAICRTDEPAAYNWCVDHDHGCCPDDYSCGECVRGVLCHECNTGLGKFSDSTDRLSAAIAYLRRSQQPKLRLAMGSGGE